MKRTAAAERLLSLGDYETAARELLPRMVYDYYAGGAEDEWTLRANRAAFQRYAFIPRVLTNVSTVNTATRLLGAELGLPVLLAPTAFQRLAHPEGELATVRAAASRQTVYVASTISTTPIEQITAAATGSTTWFQVYVFKDREITRELVQRARHAGCSALCLTATVPVQGRRERDVRNSFTLPADVQMANFTGLRQARLPSTAGSGLDAFIAREFDPSLDWSAVEWLRSISGLPVLVKGVLHPADARHAVDAGAAGIIISNHGGRQLDGAIPTLDALPRVVAAVQGDVPVLLDGGIRRGSDVLKALALGATATLIGRPYLWGLAVKGEEGVEAVLDLMRDELIRALALSGHSDVNRLSPDLLVRGDYTFQGDARPAMP